MRTTLLFAAMMAALPTFAQNDSTNNRVTLSGSIQSDMLVPTGKQADGSHEDFRTNTYVDLALQSKYVDAGARFEYLEHPLPGFEKDFKGWGVPFFYVKGKLNKAELTLGNFYDQFGSGFIFRTYEERSLGIDNSILGARLVVNPFSGVRLKALSGKQRRYWAHNDAWVSGADLELSLDEWFHALQQSGTYLTLGGSWVNKHEKADDDLLMVDASHRLNLPENVNAWDARVNLNKGPFNILAEYAQKTQDPSFDNGYIYRKGYVAMLSGSYSRKGMSLLLQAKRSDNFSFRSRRSMTGTSSMINHLPAFTEDQTYALAALYPYATHPAGEWAYQAQLGYTFRRHTALGGKYGTQLKINFSHVHGIDQSEHGLLLNSEPLSTGQLQPVTNVPTYHTGVGTKGYGSSFWKWGGGTYYQDIDVQLDKRITRDFKMHLMYMNQFYNKTVVEGEGGMIHSNIFIADLLFNLSRDTKLRTELQYLTTADDDADWAFALAELSVAPHWMFTVSDEYNCGVTNAHYWQTYVTYNLGAHRFQLGWGRTRAGYNCSGGVCRYVPESKGFTLSYNYNF
ncbi:DUF6029 family protein [Prevotella lacticifex]|uniref:Uncharacterized protein n=2 Tax=Prevotella TaxID=838 RepID=A0A9R1CCR9_9BACT|nr:hypothetical protein PRLR5003_00340 [Prevotella lacticifex]GJG40073.1 hypothetical protein PRLR5019_20440 [Prevotella lacticifex]GJG41246.1 hypothetical protein PRLR5025_00320 [Prevotella lacticifex]GJG46426.1 hypothetical protein PRLR5027_20210 [Prevotella lacticifex]GJG47599.1 hypothetical protein PRLR5052_00120 [Prevotella lacticifex]